MTDTLDVYVNDSLVGLLNPAENGAFVFTYLPDVPSTHFISLTMPVRPASYVWQRGLHPFFLMNLPEGYKKDLLRARLGSQAEVTDSGLLALTGNRTIGRVRILPHGQALQNAEDIVVLSELLASQGSRDALLRSLQKGLAEGVSGVMPKMLHEKATAVTERYLLKTGPAGLPGLAINELLCLAAARQANLPTPRAILSDDGEVLAVERFDRTPDGGFIAVEDFCALKGLDPAGKYKGSLEELAKMLNIYIPACRQAAASRQLFKLLLLNYAIRNANAHLKNYAFAYSSPDDMDLAPVYDVVTVTAFSEYRDDLPSLTLAGKRAWASGKLLQAFGATRLSLTVSEMAGLRDEVLTAIHVITPEIRRYADNFPAFRETGKRMFSEWERGVVDIQPTAKLHRDCVPEKLLQPSGFSEERLQKKRDNPYQNPDESFSYKAR